MSTCARQRVGADPLCQSRADGLQYDHTIKFTASETHLDTVGSARGEQDESRSVEGSGARGVGHDDAVAGVSAVGCEGCSGRSGRVVEVS